MTRRFRLLLQLACLALSPAAFAGVQPLESIQATAEQFVLSQLSASSAKHYATATKLDPRLQLAQCNLPLEAFATHHGELGARTTVGVRCAAQAPWTLYLPVAIEVEVPVLVLKRALARRSRVAPTNVEVQVRRLPGTVLNFINDPASLQGHRLKRALAAGAAVTVDALTPEVIVRRGQQVTLLAANGVVEIRALGEALTEGAASDRVRVQNLTSRKVVEGVVQDAATVRVAL